MTIIRVSLQVYAHRMQTLADAWSAAPKERVYMIPLAIDYARGEGACPCEHCYYAQNN